MDSGGTPESQISYNCNNDPLFLHNSDHPAMQLVNNKLNGANLQRWSRAVQIALKTKVKLGFIDGSCPKPDPSSQNYHQWIKVDNMVVSWLLNSITPEVADAFLYANSAYELWSELAERFGQSNGPLLYQIQKEIDGLYQENDSVAVYYTKLKKLWDELSDMSEISACNCVHNSSCTALKKNLELEQRQKLMQFLMHLNDSYDTIRGQILLMDPLPPVNKAYSMIQRVEKQRQVTNNSAPVREVAANVTRLSADNQLIDSATSGSFLVKGHQGNRRDNRRSKSTRFCDHCQRNGHTKDQCFKLVGYPDWYEGARSTEGPRGNAKNRQPTRFAANVNTSSPIMDTPLKEGEINQGLAGPTMSDTNMLKVLAQEMMKLMQQKQSAEHQPNHLSAYAQFAGPFN